MSQAVPLPSSLELARRLVDALEAGDTRDSGDLLEALNDGRFEALFRELGKLTREFHDTYANLCQDERLATIAHSQIPDARARLQYVIDKTAEATDRTLGAVETLIPLSDELMGEAAGLRARLVGLDDARVIKQEVDRFLERTLADGQRLRGGLTDVLLAQEYQDLTGQVIKRTMDLVTQVEEKLVVLVSACSLAGRGEVRVAEAGASHGPVMAWEESVVGRQADVDDLLANLGF